MSSGLSIDYTEKLVEPEHYAFGENLCFDCNRSFGKCPWTEVDRNTGAIKFQPIEGWKIETKRVKTGREWRFTEQIVECPLFDKTDRK